MIYSIAKEFGVLPDEVEKSMSERWFKLHQVILEEKNRGK